MVMVGVSTRMEYLVIRGLMGLLPGWILKNS